MFTIDTTPLIRKNWSVPVGIDALGLFGVGIEIREPRGRPRPRFGNSISAVLISFPLFAVSSFVRKLPRSF